MNDHLLQAAAQRRADGRFVLGGHGQQVGDGTHDAGVVEAQGVACALAVARVTVQGSFQAFPFAFQGGEAGVQARVLGVEVAFPGLQGGTAVREFREGLLGGGAAFAGLQ